MLLRGVFRAHSRLARLRSSPCIPLLFVSEHQHRWRSHCPKDLQPADHGLPSGAGHRPLPSPAMAAHERGGSAGPDVGRLQQLGEKEADERKRASAREGQALSVRPSDSEFDLEFVVVSGSFFFAVGGDGR